MAIGSAARSIVQGLFPEAATSLRKTMGGMEVDTMDEGMLARLKDPELVLGPQGVASMMEKVNPQVKAKMQEEMDLAYKMRDEGEPLTDIEARTGFMFDDQGRILKEINDNAATLKKPLEDLNKEKEYNLNEVFDHKSFFAVYPDLAKTRIRFYKGKSTENGFFDIKDGLIGINLNNKAFIDKDEAAVKDTVRTVLHEGQHLIQKLEGMQVGGNPEMFMPGGSSGLNLSKQEATQRYLKLMGEAQARNVAFRYGKKTGRDFLKTLATDPQSVQNNINKYRLIKNTGEPYRAVSQEEFVDLNYKDPFEDSDLFERTIK
jgi:hypothetical protein